MSQAKWNAPRYAPGICSVLNVLGGLAFVITVIAVLGFLGGSNNNKDLSDLIGVAGGCFSFGMFMIATSFAIKRIDAGAYAAEEIYKLLREQHEAATSVDVAAAAATAGTDDGPA